MDGVMDAANTMRQRDDATDPIATRRSKAVWGNRRGGLIAGRHNQRNDGAGSPRGSREKEAGEAGAARHRTTR